jgi:hypothetical protein
VSQELESKLPIPESAVKTLAEYAYIEHFTYGLSIIALLKTDNNTSTHTALC